MTARADPGPLRVVTVWVIAVSLVVMTGGTGGGTAGASTAHRPPALRAVVLAAIGFGYTVTGQGPLDASRFPAGSPSATAAAGALSTLGDTIGSYQRSWQDATGSNEVQDLVVRFPTGAGADAFIGAARRAIEHGETVRSAPLPSIPGAERTTYFASTPRAGVGQTITMRAGDYAAVLSFVSAASGNPAPISAVSAERVAEAQEAALASAAAAAGQETAGGHRGSPSNVGWVVFAVVVPASALITLVQRRRGRGRKAEADPLEDQVLP